MKHAIRVTALLCCLAQPAGVWAHDGYDRAIHAYGCVDYPKAYALFKGFAEKEGHALSQYMMGIMTEQGQGTEANVNQAFDWYMAAAKQGVTDAYYALADMYAKGIGVTKDPARAYAWFDLAYKGGHKLAGDMLQGLEKELHKDQLAEALQFETEWLAKLGR